MIISLIGYRGTGKSTVGRILSDRLHCDFLDSDTEIVTRSGMPISEIFENSGEAAFRQMESEVIADLMTQESAVISWGGGVVLSEMNRREIKKSDLTIWLIASEKILAERISNDPSSIQNRPALTDLSPIEEIGRLLREREPLYRETADWSLETDGLSPDEIADRIMIRVKS